MLKYMLAALLIPLSSCSREKVRLVYSIDKNSMQLSHKVEVQDTIIDLQKMCLLFLQKAHPLLFEGQSELVYYKEKDMNVDGKIEIIIAFGYKDRGLLKKIGGVCVLQNDRGTLKEIKQDYDSTFQKNYYSMNSIELISLQGNKQNYIYVGLTKYSSAFDGFMLLGLQDNKVTSFFCSISDTGLGKYKLLDEDEDGKYEGYLESRKERNTLFYEINSKYLFKDNAFRVAAVNVEIPNYPDSVKEVLLQYISLRSLDFGELISVNQRLLLLCSDNINNLKWNKKLWKDAYLNSYFGLKSQIKFHIEESNKTAIATLAYFDSNKMNKLQFELQKINDKWQIAKIELQ